MIAREPDGLSGSPVGDLQPCSSPRNEIFAGDHRTRLGVGHDGNTRLDEPGPQQIFQTHGVEGEFLHQEDVIDQVAIKEAAVGAGAGRTSDPIRLQNCTNCEEVTFERWDAIA